MLLNGLIGCSSGHPLIKKCIDAIDLEKVRKQNNVISTTGPRLVTNVLLSYVKNLSNLSDEKILVFPAKYFYPISNSQKQKDQYLDYVVNETYAVHFWSMSWKKK